MKKGLLGFALTALALSACATAPIKTTEIAPKAAQSCGMDSRPISVKTVGSGADVILIPGLGSPPDVYEQIIAQNKGQFRFHLVHVAGYAGLPSSQSEGSVFDCAGNAIADYLKKARIRNATIIGHSMGGELAMAINARNNGLVGRILVVDALPFYSLLFGPTLTPDLIRPRATAFTQMIMGQNDEAFRTSQIAAIARLVKSETDRARVLAWSLASTRYAIAKGAEDLMVTDLRPELLQNKAEITMLYAYDAQMGLSQAVVDGLYANAYKDIPNVTLKRIDNSFHFIMFDRPLEFSEEVKKFLSQ